VDWPAHRRWLSIGGNAYARIALGVPVRDLTAGYRAYRAAALRDILDGRGSGIHSRGYCFQIDMTLRTVDAGWQVRELPITFVERAAGRSKMTRAIVAEAMARVTAWAFSRRVLGRRSA